MATPPGRLQLISSQTLGAHVPRRLVALLDTIARADHISREHVVRRALVREVEQHNAGAGATAQGGPPPARRSTLSLRLNWRRSWPM